MASKSKSRETTSTASQELTVSASPPDARGGAPDSSFAAPSSPHTLASDTFVMPANPRRPSRSRKTAMMVSALIVIGIPTAAAAVYYTLAASDQYAASGHFVVRQQHQDSGGTAGAALFGQGMGRGGGAMGALGDVMIVNDYMASMQMVKDLEPHVDLRAIYSRKDADWLARLKPARDTGQISDEHLRDYWRKMAVVHFDQTTGLSVFEVRAFSAEDAKNIADQVFKLSEDLVNRISERAQADALQLARREVETYRAKALESLDNLLAFQERARQVDPQGFAAARNRLQAGIEQEVTQLQAELEVLRKKLPEDAPGIQQVKDRLQVVERQLLSERERSTSSADGESAAKLLNEFEKLKLESEFATQSYMSSLDSLERARVEAIRQNLYLETFVRPHLPQIPEYPRALINTLMVFAVSFLVWAIGGLLVSAAREHA